MKFVIYSTLISIFSESVVYHAAIDLKLFYFIVLLNLMIIAYFKGLHINLWHLGGMLIVFTASFFSIFVNIQSYLMQVAGISLVSIYYYMFFREVNIPAISLFKIYLKLSMIVASLGIFIVLIRLILFGELDKLHSVMLEPSHYVMVILPAWYYTFSRYRFLHFHTMLFTLTILLSGSAVGILGILLGFILKTNFSIKRMMLALIMSSVLSVSLYNFNEDFRLRVDDTFMAISSLSLKGVNLSTYALLSNAYVAYKSFSDSPVFGGGLGSHGLQRKQYLHDIVGIDEFEQYSSLNEKDANSLLLRIVSELGSLGLIIVIVFLVRFGISLKGEELIISRGILIYFFIKLLREGHYFSPEMYFFIMCYLYIYKQRNYMNYNTIKVCS